MSRSTGRSARRATRRARRRAENRRQGRVGRAHRAGRASDVPARDRRFQGKSGVMPAEGRQRRTDRRRSAACRRVHGQRTAGAGWKEPAVPAARRRAARSCRAHRRAGRRRDLRQVPPDGRRRRAEDRRSRRMDPAREARVRPRPQSALKGHAGMPARGGLADLSDAEVKRAVEYMMNCRQRRARRGGRRPLRRRRRPAAAPRRDGKKVYDSELRGLPRARVSPVRRSSATRPRGRRASSRAWTCSTRTPSRLKGKGA